MDKQDIMLIPKSSRCGGGKKISIYGNANIFTKSFDEPDYSRSWANQRGIKKLNAYLEPMTK